MKRKNEKPSCTMILEEVTACALVLSSLILGTAFWACVSGFCSSVISSLSGWDLHNNNNRFNSASDSREKKGEERSC